MHSLHYIADTVKGTTHIENQDGYVVIPTGEYLLFALFDGVSLSENQLKGVRCAIEFIENCHQDYYDYGRYHLRDLMLQINLAILKCGWSDALTTFCSAVTLFSNNKSMLISHLGDSRIYTLNDKDLKQHTDDDVVYPGSNILTKCLGIERLEDSDFYQKSIDFTDARVLFCTDGFYHLLEQNREEFLEILSNSDMNRIHSLIRSAVDGKNRDDSTYILVNPVR
jgi:serine/threonine protein phosphatase PrpC